MKRPFDQASSLGFTGLLTALIVWGLQELVPGPAFRPLIMLLGGLFGAAIASEVLLVWATWRLERERTALSKLLSVHEALHADLERVLGERERFLLERNASKKAVAGLQTELDQSRGQYTSLFSRIRDRLSRITDQISG